jgi:hypothetical protein
MITCAVCNAENDRLSMTCKQCGGYLQTRVDNLDLFETSWNVLEKPFKTFHAIAIARHKNYMLILSGSAGFAITFFLFWIFKAAEYTESLLNILISGLVVGPFVGIFVVILFSLCVKLVGMIVRASATYKQILAVSAYALVPTVISVILILPIELMTFGIYLFSKNPSPFMLKPVSYSVLIGIDGFFTLWTLMLLLIGLKVAFTTSWLKATFIAVVSLFVLGIISASMLLKLFPPQM